jgi:hypothetical protein
MKKYCNGFLITALSLTCVLWQSCLKDKTLKDKEGGIHLDISPSYGVPLANVTIDGENMAKFLNKDSASHSWFIEFDRSDHDLCVIVYDKENISFALPNTITSIDTTAVFPISSYLTDLRKQQGWLPKEAWFFLYADNGYTTQIDLDLQLLDYKDENQVTLPLTHSLLLTNPILPATSASVKRRSLVVDKLIVEDPVEIALKAIDIRMQFRLSYGQITNNGMLNLNPILKIPVFFFTPTGVHRSDTTGVNLSAIAEIFEGENISLKNITLYLKVINGMPLDATTQIYFADANYRILDSIKTGGDILVKSGIPNAANYLVVQKVETVEEIALSEQQYNKIKDAKYLIIKEFFTSYQQKPVKIFKSNTMDVILSAKVDTHVQGDLDDVRDVFSTNK